MAGTVFFKIVFIPDQDQVLPFFPAFKLKGSGTTGMTAEILSEFFHHFMRNYRTILHAEQTQHRMERRQQPKLKSGVVGCRKRSGTFHFFVEYPGPAAG